MLAVAVAVGTMHWWWARIRPSRLRSETSLGSARWPPYSTVLAAPVAAASSALQCTSMSTIVAEVVRFAHRLAGLD